MSATTHDLERQDTERSVLLARARQRKATRRTAQGWPRGSPCAKPQVGIDGNPGDPVFIEIDCLEGRRHLPIIRVRRAA
jgi:hypothetical protein